LTPIILIVFIIIVVLMCSMVEAPEQIVTKHRDQLLSKLKTKKQRKIAHADLVSPYGALPVARIDDCQA
jgi:hypothetical protein